jgi:hypothetical protein
MINTRGNIRWDWPTTLADADPTARPYNFFFRIPGHGRSDTIQVVAYSGDV